MATFKFINGALGLYESSTVAYPGYYSRIDICGENGSVILQNNAVVEWHMRDGLEYSTQKTELPHRCQLQDITDSIISGTESAVCGEEAIKPLKVIEAVYESVRTGKAIKVKQ